MYYPVLRGKQFELIALRDLCSILNKEQFCPIFEPVRSKLQPLSRTIEHLNKIDVIPIVIINPTLGDFKANIVPNQNTIEDELYSTIDDLNFIPCFSTKGHTADSLSRIINGTNKPFAVFIEEGLGKDMLPILSDAVLVIAHKYLRAPFKTLSNIVIVEDNFTKAVRNSDYPQRSYFSDRHTDYKEGTNVIGYGDYAITSKDFVESGGPAYVIAIHLSYIDPDEFDAMYIRHFKSFDDKSPTRPGEKFGNALDKLVEFYDSNPKIFNQTLGLKGFRKLKEEDHFPGLGQVKKLSIQHHIETLCQYGES